MLNQSGQGTFGYLAPEILECGSTIHDGNFTKESDVWSIGLTFYTSCMHSLPDPVKFIIASRDDDYEYPGLPEGYTKEISELL